MADDLFVIGWKMDEISHHIFDFPFSKMMDRTQINRRLDYALL